MASSNAMASSTRKLSSASAKIATHCSPSTTSRPSTGSTYARQTRSRARSRPFGIERSDQGGCLSNKTALAMIFKLAQAAEKSWHRLRGHDQLPKVILGVKFNDGIEVIRSLAQTAAA